MNFKFNLTPILTEIIFIFNTKLVRFFFQTHTHISEGALLRTERSKRGKARSVFYRERETERSCGDPYILPISMLFCCSYVAICGGEVVLNNEIFWDGERIKQDKIYETDVRFLSVFEEKCSSHQREPLNKILDNGIMEP